MSCRWRSYFTSGSSAVYLFLYSAFYFYTKLDITKVRQRIHRLKMASTLMRCILHALSLHCHQHVTA